MSSGTISGTFYLVDAHALIFQVFHAIRGMTSPSGVPTNALFGFTRDLLFLRGLRPDYLVCAFDRAEPTFRSAIYPEYKAHREAMPNDLQLQMPLIHRLLDAMNVPVLSVAGFEADDVLATLALTGSRHGLEVFLCSSDKDCRQLIDDRVRMYSLRKRAVFGRDELLADWGIKPEQVVDLQTLVGDAVDNVRGVPGIGIKTAAKLLQDFGTLENILANIDRVPGAKRQESLRNSGDIIEQSRKLVRLSTEVPIELDWEAWRLRDMDRSRLGELFQEWGFHSLANQFRESSHTTGQVQGELFPFGANAPDDFGERGRVSAPSEQTLGALTRPRSLQDWQADYHLVDSEDKFELFYRQLREQKRIAFDLETTSLSPLQAEIVGFAFSWRAGEAWYLALRGPEGAAVLDPATTLARLRPILEDPGVAKINQNIKYDLLVLRGRGVQPRGVAGDPMVADYLLHAGERSHGLEELARRYLNHQVIPITDLIGKKSRKTPQLRMDQVPTERVAVYAGEDADVAWRLCELLETQLNQPEAQARGSLRKLYDDVEVPLIEVLAELEFNGIRLDLPLLRRLSVEMGQQLAIIEKAIYELAGHSFNIGSLVQLRKVLFEELKLPVQGKTGITGAASTDQETLEKLAALDHPSAALPRKILEHRRIAKLKSTYVDALPEMVNPDTGRVHASFNQTVASTGRLSSSDPNLQNIPVRREDGQQIRQAFLPAEGWQLLTADYSQIELRLLAHFCGDDELRRAFAEDRDIHATVAAQIFGVPETDVNADQRRMAKTVNFGVIYGISPAGLGQRLEISRDEAAKFIAAYFARYPKVQEYQDRLLSNCRQDGYVATILGRRRYFDREAIRSNSTYQQRNSAEREAINMEVQGSAADLIKLAMLNVHRRLHREKRRARLLLQIHDELVFEAPPEELHALAELVREEMTIPVARTLKLEVPLRVDLASGPNWLDVTEMKSA
ncbi:MAG TPA: DNA polymerase I [Gemmataceae bacterium]|nr:DNA polymerase I [Gemmataceae bacterium]